MTSEPTGADLNAYHVHVNPCDCDPVGVTEIARRLGRPRDTIQKWRTRHQDFPQPRWTIHGAAAWNWPDIAAWVNARVPQPDHRFNPETTRTPDLLAAHDTDRPDCNPRRLMFTDNPDGVRCTACGWLAVETNKGEPS